MARSVVCCLWRCGNALSTGAFRQVCITIRCVLLSRLCQGQDRCPSLQFHTGGRGVRLPSGLPFGARSSRALRGFCDLSGACSDARTHPAQPIAPALTACSVAISCRRLLIFSSTDHDDLWLPRHLRWSCTRSWGPRARDASFLHAWTAGSGHELGPVWAARAHVECL